MCRPVDENPQGGEASRGRGRPPGSITLTEQIEQKIVSFVQAGAFAHAAAQAAGVPPRTFYEWMERGEGTHPTRRPTPRLRAFAKAVLTAQAQARVVAETRVFRERPTYWLSHAARSRPGEEGWTEPPEDPEAQWSGSLEERLAELDSRDAESRAWHTTNCTEPDCPCRTNRRPEDEYPSFKAHPFSIGD